MRKSILFCLVFFTVVFSCKKFDNQKLSDQTQSNAQLRDQFFDVSNADPEVQKVAANIRKQDSVFKFLTSFIKKNGIPKWDKVLYQVQKGNRIFTHSNPAGSNNARSSDEEADQGLFLIPLQSANSSEIKSYITAYKHSDSLYTYRLYNKDSLDGIHPDSLQERKNLLNTEAVFGYFEKTINNNDSISVSGPGNGKIKNVQIGFANTQGTHSTARENELTCEITMTLTLEYEYRQFVYGPDEWVLVSMTLDIEITCTGGGGGDCGCSSLDPNGPSNYWWSFGSGWPWYNTGGWQGYYYDPNDPWYPWWTSGGGASVNPFPPAEVEDVDVSQINDPCLAAVLAHIAIAGHQSAILKAYDILQYTPSTPDRYKLIFVEDNTLVGSNGQPVPGRTIENDLPDGTHVVEIKLNPTLFAGSSKEWVTAVIVHELLHGILLVKRPDLINQQQQHEFMFSSRMPTAIYESLAELFPGIDIHDALALGMDGLSDGYMINDPNNPGSQIIDPVKDSFAQTNFFQNINQAVTTASSYQNGTSGTPYC